MPVAPGTVIKQNPAKASDALAWEFMQGRVPFFVRLGDFATGAGGIADATNSWLLTRTRQRTIMAIWVDAGGTFSGKFQACYDKDGTNWYDLVPEAGSTGTANPVTAVGIYIFTGPYYYLRWLPTAIGTATMHIDAATMAL